MDKLKEIINRMLKNLGEDEIEILNRNLSLKDDLDIDSISYTELVVDIERSFGININSQGRAERLGDVIDRLNL